MPNKYIGPKYLCAVCKNVYYVSTASLDTITMQHSSGEVLELTMVECPHCGSMSLPEGMNQISWCISNKENKYGN